MRSLARHWDIAVASAALAMILCGVFGPCLRRALGADANPAPGAS
jgi:hypothetical protein